METIRLKNTNVLMRLLRLLLFATPSLFGVEVYSQVPAAVLAPGVISTTAYEGPFAFTPDGRTIYFTRLGPGMKSPGFFASHLQDGKWADPKPVQFPEGASPAPFCFSPDGGKLYYTHAAETNGHSRLWLAERDGEGWKNARPLGGVFEKWEGDQTSPSLTADGTLYFAANRPGHSGGWDIYRSALKDGQYQEPERLGGERYGRISTLQPETSVTVARDGSYLIFSSSGSGDGVGGSDLYLAELSAPVWRWAWPWNLGFGVNTPADEVDARISPDGKRLYFCRSGDIYEADLESLRRAPAESAVWKPRGDMPLAREAAQAVVAQGRIYVHAGTTGGWGTGKPPATANQVDVFDPATGGWTKLAAPPQGWNGATLMSLDDRLLLFQPFPAQAPALAEYNSALKQWEIKRAANPSAEAWPGGSRSIQVGRKAYTFFAVHGLRDFEYMVEYDFDTGLSTPRRAVASANHLIAFGDRIYGFCTGEDGSQVVVYDPTTGQWDYIARMNTLRWGAATVAFKDEIWLLGGHGHRSGDEGGDQFITVTRFNPRSKTWTNGPALPERRISPVAAVVNGRLFVMGGFKPGPAFAHDPSVLEYVPESEIAPE